MTVLPHLYLQDLFKKVVPHHCLGCVWSRRDKKQRKALTVMATVDQFNAISYRSVIKEIGFFESKGQYQTVC